jgi:ribose transport system ATP-binding protein
VSTSPYLLEVSEVSKKFPGVQALDRVSLCLRQAEVLAVIGENGAGKSTLMKILAGILRPDAGHIRVDGVPVQFHAVREALARGIVLIHQELNLAENLSVAANLYLGRERTWGGRLGILEGRRMNGEARALMSRVGLECSPSAPVGELAPGRRQLVEIGRALSLAARILIMDEPTSSLSHSESDRLFALIAELKQAGVAVVYISHRLQEVGRVADRVVVLRDGRSAGELKAGGLSHEAMVRLMVGRELQQFFPRRHSGAKEVPRIRLEVRGVRFAGGPAQPISLHVNAGEIVGVAGLVGAGRTELAEALFGIRRLTAGQVLVDGTEWKVRSPRDAVAAGLLLVPEDRRFHGLILEDSVQHNIGLPNLDRLSVLRMVALPREAALTRQMCGRLGVRHSGPGQTVGFLSGGNQQKVVLAKWLARQPRVVIFDEPTRGIDVAAKGEIYALLDRLAAGGVAVLMISSDLEEILRLSDRVLVLHQGRLVAELSREDMNEEAIMRWATGGGEGS